MVYGGDTRAITKLAGTKKRKISEIFHINLIFFI